ncbi:Bug family tripartite tricarboxylate transporter substrate binding protein [Xylophilus sp.]|uniref:Bug family tripartite tricarboxylate transporter substrate binding protein n=1 Tax=Xylophilus sp. TaxID=2653893 RepID=UPI0013BC2A78|nr:Bug family tripartite tricarboxylate transporter substrate binding protein [Xylophilus sp.]KAF1046979.1 MAG: hypothetical protein GAK38_02196 [Xylophilus sp.]
MLSNMRTSFDPSHAASRRGFLAGALAAAVPGIVQAQSGTSRILVGFAAGGGGDLVARLLAERLPRHLGAAGQNVLVDNRPGGAGKIAVDALRNAPPDGNTLLLAPLVTPVLSQLVFRNPGYDPARDFAPVGVVGHFQFGLAVPASHPARDVPSFIAWLKANPAKAYFGSPSPGSLPHFFGLLLGEAAGVDYTHVSYRGGAPMLNDLAAGQITSGIDTVQKLLELHRSGRIRVLGVFAPRRVPQLPDVPTLAEQGYPKATGSGWYSLWAVAGTPVARQREWNAALNATLREPAVQKKFDEWALEPAPGTPEQLEALRRSDIEKWRLVIAASGFKAD